MHAALVASAGRVEWTLQGASITWFYGGLGLGVPGLLRLRMPFCLTVRPQASITQHLLSEISEKKPISDYWRQCSSLWRYAGLIFHHQWFPSVSICG